MKIVHKNEAAESDWIKAASRLEREGQLEAAVKAWKKVLDSHPINLKAYDRLMIIYRKLKDPRNELKIIDAALAIHGSDLKKRQAGYDRKVITLSKSLLKLTGLADKKGNSIHQPGELTRWTKRKAIVKKKIAALKKDQ